MKTFRYEINFDDQVFLMMDGDFTNPDDVRNMAVKVLDHQGFRCTRTSSIRAEDSPILHHCLVETAKQLGIQSDIKIGISCRYSEIQRVFHECASEMWDSMGIRRNDEFLIPYNAENVEALMAIADRLVSLQEVVVHDNFEDTIRGLVPEPRLSRYSLDSDLDAVSLRRTVAFRWKNLEVSGLTSSARQVLKALDEKILREHTTDRFVHVQLTDYAGPTVSISPMRGNTKEFPMHGEYARDVKVIFHGYFPHATAQSIMRFVNVAIDKIMGRRYSKKATINVGICDDELRVEPPDAIRVPSNRLRGYTSMPTLALAAAHIAQLIDKIRFRRPGIRFVKVA